VFDSKKIAEGKYQKNNASRLVIARWTDEVIKKEYEQRHALDIYETCS